MLFFTAALQCKLSIVQNMISGEKKNDLHRLRSENTGSRSEFKRNTTTFARLQLVTNVVTCARGPTRLDHVEKIQKKLCRNTNRRRFSEIYRTLFVKHLLKQIAFEGVVSCNIWASNSNTVISCSRSALKFQWES